MHESAKVTSQSQSQSQSAAAAAASTAIACELYASRSLALCASLRLCGIRARVWFYASRSLALCASLRLCGIRVYMCVCARVIFLRGFTAPARARMRGSRAREGGAISRVGCRMSERAECPSVVGPTLDSTRLDSVVGGPLRDGRTARRASTGDDGGG